MEYHYIAGFPGYVSESRSPLRALTEEMRLQKGKNDLIHFRDIFLNTVFFQLQILLKDCYDFFGYFNLIALEETSYDPSQNKPAVSTNAPS